MTDREEHLRRLREAGARDDADIDLAATALVLAALDRPECRIADYGQHLAVLANDVASEAREASDVPARVDAIRSVIFDRHGYAGDSDTYDDMQNANLMSVIDRRRGLPVALGILCIHAARAQGWDMKGVNFPSHFLIRLRTAGQSAVIDPFDAARVLDDAALRRRLAGTHGADAKLDPSHCRPIGNRDVLIRLQNNIRIRALRDNNAPRALEIGESMVLLAPRHEGLRLELASLQARTGKLRSAVRGLEAFLELAGESGRHGQAAQVLRDLKAKLN